MSLFQFYFLEFTAVNILLAWGIYLVFRADQVYFGPMYSMCIGAYCAAYLARDLHAPFWLAMAGGVVLAVLFSLIFARQLASLAGFPMMLATTALIFIVQTVIRNLDFLGGSQGFFNIPFVSEKTMVAVTYALVALCGALVYRLDYSYLGRAMDAIKFDANVAKSLGIDTVKLSVRLQLVSSALGALAGTIYAFTLGALSPGGFGFSTIATVVAIVMVGGAYTMWGIVVVAPVFFAISQYAPSGFANIMYALVLIIILVVRPTGLVDRGVIKVITRMFRALGRRTGTTSSDA
ncbi:MAG: branched-chain amino acid ABC transporter permease [Armatimonadetes bacterium]|nr:branched-chain amino acid ABC transporter permease [Armatimonadota bacterium]